MEKRSWILGHEASKLGGPTFVQYGLHLLTSELCYEHHFNDSQRGMTALSPSGLGSLGLAYG
jgi:hypothetical protein